MSFRPPVVALASATQTTSGTSALIPVTDTGATLHLLANVTAASGTTPTLNLAVQWTHDGTTFAPADVADSFATQLTAVSAFVKSFPVRGTAFRIAWTIAGTTPSFTFAVTALVTP